MARPMPPASMIDCSEFPGFGIRLTPAPEVWEWLKTEILADTGSIHNEDHAHLLDADIQVMWASSSFEKQGRTVLGQAEQVAFRAGGWQKARTEQQMRDWFGDVPAFIITLAADYCAQCSDLEFCALLEHELYHLAHATDKYGQPASLKMAHRRSSCRDTMSRNSSVSFAATVQALTFKRWWMQQTVLLRWGN